MHVVNKNTYFCHFTLLRNFSTLFHSNKPVWLHRTRKSEGPCCVTLARNYLEWFITTSSSRTNWHSWSRPLLYHSPSVHPEHWTTNCCYWSNSLVTFNNKKDTLRRIDFNYVHCRRKAAEAAGFLLSSLALDGTWTLPNCPQQSWPIGRMIYKGMPWTETLSQFYSLLGLTEFATKLLKGLSLRILCHSSNERSERLCELLSYTDSDRPAGN